MTAQPSARARGTLRQKNRRLPVGADGWKFLESGAGKTQGGVAGGGLFQLLEGRYYNLAFMHMIRIDLEHPGSALRRRMRGDQDSQWLGNIVGLIVKEECVANVRRPYSAAYPPAGP